MCGGGDVYAMVVVVSSKAVTDHLLINADMNADESSTLHLRAAVTPRPGTC